MTQFEADIGDLDGLKAIAEEHGFCLVRNVFSPAEVEAIKAGMKRTHEAFGADAPDLLSCPELAWLLFDQRITTAARRLLGDELVYYAESNLNYEEDIGPLTLAPYAELHCDAFGVPTNLWAPWSHPSNELYRAYRFGLYFHDYGTSSGALKVGVGTHRGDPHPIMSSRGLSDQKERIHLGNIVAKVRAPSVRLFDVPARPGDVVVWNLRTFHAAGAKRLKLAPDIALHPHVEIELHRASPELFFPPPGPRLALFFDYGAPAESADLYIKHRARSKSARRLFPTKHCNHDTPENLERAKRHGLTLRSDFLAHALALDLLDGTSADPQATAARLMKLLAGHREFSPHFPLLESARVQADLARGEASTLQAVVHRIGTIRDEVIRLRT